MTLPILRAVGLLAFVFVSGCASTRMVAVFDPSGNPVPGASVFYVGKNESDERLSGRIDTNGEGVAHLPETKTPVSVVIHKQGFEPAQVQVFKEPVIRIILMKNRAPAFRPKVTR